MTRFPSRGRLVAAVSLAACLAGPAFAADLDWLEPPTDPAALKWARTQTADAKARLSAEPGYAGLLAELGTVLKAAAPIADIDLLGPRAVRLQRDAAHPKGLLQVADRGKDGTLRAWRTVLDVAAFGTAEGKPYTLNWAYGSSCLAPRFERCLLAFSDGGSDELSIREFDLKTGGFVRGGFVAPASRVQTAWIDQDTVLIAHGLAGSAKTAAGWSAAARLWKRGTAAESAPVVFTAPASDATLQFVAASPGVALMTRVIDYSTFEVRSVDAAGKVEVLPLPPSLKPFGPLGGVGRKVVVQFANAGEVQGREVPAESVVAYDLDTRRTELVYAPAPGEVISSFNGFPSSAGRVFLPVQRSLKTTLVAATPGRAGWSLKPLTEGAAGEDIGIASADPAGEDVVVRRTSFLTPLSLELIGKGGARKVLAKGEEVFDASKYRVQVKSAMSKDGTAIDYYLVAPKAPAKPGQTPTLITGYGAFGITLTPAYLGRSFGGQALKLWFDRGGALVLPAIRGGGERGGAWHQAAIREKRQVSYDDFIAVTEALVNGGFTRPERIGVFGTSNGGLLSATVAVQRPDLYGAVISDVPLADMIRYPKIAMGAAWMDEYGDPSVPAIRQALEAYSPLHNIRPGVPYPPFLVTISTTDNRVGPGHARKLAARLREVGSTVYFLEDEEGGHGVSDPLSRPDIMAMRMEFLIGRLMTP